MTESTKCPIWKNDPVGATRRPLLEWRTDWENAPRDGRPVWLLDPFGHAHKLRWSDARNIHGLGGCWTDGVWMMSDFGFRGYIPDYPDIVKIKGKIKILIIRHRSDTVYRWTECVYRYSKRRGRSMRIRQIYGSPAALQRRILEVARRGWAVERSAIEMTEQLGTWPAMATLDTTITSEQVIYLAARKKRKDTE